MRRAILGRPLFKRAYPLLLITLLWASADTIFTYTAPVLLEERFHDLTLVGLVTSLGAVASIAIDLLTGWKFAHKHYAFFFFSGLVMSFLIFFISMIDHALILPILLAMGGAYYELLWFGNQAYMATQIEVKQHGRVSAMLIMMMTIASIVPPLLISEKIEQGDYRFAFNAFLFFIAAAGGVFFLLMVKGKKHDPKASSERVRSVSILKELKIWRLVSTHSWPLIIMIIFSGIFDSFFWTIGSLFAIEYSHISDSANLFIPLYMFPGLFAGLVASKMITKIRIDRLMSITSVASGAFIALFLFTDDLNLLLLLNFLSAVLGLISYNLMDTMFADLCTRLGEESNYMIGLRGFASDIGYIVGPISAGVLAEMVGIKNAFGWIGVLIVVVSMVMLLMHHHKIRLPKAQIESIDNGQ